MKTWICLAFILLCNSLIAQPVLSNDPAAMELLLEKELRYKDFQFKSSKDHYNGSAQTADSLGVHYLKVADLNHDGRDDLFAMGFAKTKKRPEEFEEVIIAIASKKGFRRVEAKNYFFRNWFVENRMYPKIIDIEGLEYLQVTYELTTDGCEEIGNKWKVDTLYVKNDFLIPYAKPINPGFASVTLRTNQCFGSCPIFELTINQDGSGAFEGIKYTSKIGKMNFGADKEDVSYLNEILGLINFKQMKEDYFVCWTDDQTGYLTVNFSDGRSYEIEDYGLSGTHRLTLLYNYLFDLSKVK